MAAMLAQLWPAGSAIEAQRSSGSTISNRYVLQLTKLPHGPPPPAGGRPVIMQCMHVWRLLSAPCCCANRLCLQASAVLSPAWQEPTCMQHAYVNISVLLSPPVQFCCGLLCRCHHIWPAVHPPHHTTCGTAGCAAAPAGLWYRFHCSHSYVYRGCHIGIGLSLECACLLKCTSHLILGTSSLRHA